MSLADAALAGEDAPPLAVEADRLLCACPDPLETAAELEAAEAGQTGGVG